MRTVLLIIAVLLGASALNANTANKKTYTFDTHSQKRTAPPLKIDDLNVALAGN